MDATELKEEISLLDHWIEQREAELMAALVEFQRRERDLIRLSSSPAEVEAQHKKTEGLGTEIDRLNELRQIRELKMALLQRLEGTSHGQVAR